MKYLGLDYGSKKLGLAISDERGSLAFPYKILPNKNPEQLKSEILAILAQEKIQNLVVGESTKLNGQVNEILKETQEFVKNLQTSNPELKIFWEKEWFSTVEARRYDDRRNADDSAAAIILQRFLDKQ